eukprot:gene42683-52152_t
MAETRASEEDGVVARMVADSEVLRGQYDAAGLRAEEGVWRDTEVLRAHFYTAHPGRVGKEVALAVLEMLDKYSFRQTTDYLVFFVVRFGGQLPRRMEAMRAYYEGIVIGFFEGKHFAPALRADPVYDLMYKFGYTRAKDAFETIYQCADAFQLSLLCDDRFTDLRHFLADAVDPRVLVRDLLDLDAFEFWLHWASVDTLQWVYALPGEGPMRCFRALCAQVCPLMLRRALESDAPFNLPVRRWMLALAGGLPSLSDPLQGELPDTMKQILGDSEVGDFVYEVWIQVMRRRPTPADFPDGVDATEVQRWLDARATQAKMTSDLAFRCDGEDGERAWDALYAELGLLPSRVKPQAGCMQS